MTVAKPIGTLNRGGADSCCCSGSRRGHQSSAVSLIAQNNRVMLTSSASADSAGRSRVICTSVLIVVVLVCSARNSSDSCSWFRLTLSRRMISRQTLGVGYIFSNSSVDSARSCSAELCVLSAAEFLSFGDSTDIKSIDSPARVKSKAAPKWCVLEVFAGMLEFTSFIDSDSNLKRSGCRSESYRRNSRLRGKDIPGLCANPGDGLSRVHVVAAV